MHSTIERMCIRQISSAPLGPFRQISGTARALPSNGPSCQMPVKSTASPGPQLSPPAWLTTTESGWVCVEIKARVWMNQLSRYLG